MNDQTFDPRLDTLIWGARDIGRAINCNKRKVYYLASEGYIDVDKCGVQLVSTLRRLAKPRAKAAQPEAAEAPRSSGAPVRQSRRRAALQRRKRPPEQPTA